MSILMDFLLAIPDVSYEVALALLPIAMIFLAYQVFFAKMPRRQFMRMIVGIAYTFVGLVLFLVGVEVGFEPAGTEMGEAIGSGAFKWALIPVGLTLGFVIVFAEPAVAVLNQQIETVSDGAISGKLMMGVLCAAMAVAVALGMIRVLTGLSIWWILIPGYTLALILMKFSPNIFTAIAFDSGGVSSGPMTATFLLPFAVGAAGAIPGRDALTDAFGMVAMVAMMPLIAIQILGVAYQIRLSRSDLSAADLAELGEDDEYTEGEDTPPEEDAAK